MKYSNNSLHNYIKGDIKFIDLFAGIGGTRIAFENAGASCVFSSEWDKYSQQTYKENFGETPKGDITQIQAKEIPEFDILVGGFPCQPFSSIGKREGFKHKVQGTLFYDIVRILDKKRPISFLLENVAGLTNHDDGKTFKIILESLDKLGYKIFNKILNSADFGVPQKRRRIYIVGFKNDLFNEAINFNFPEGNQNVYIKDFLEDNPKGYSISQHLQNSYIYKKKDSHPEVVDNNSKIQVKTLVATYHKIQRITGTFVKGGETGLRLLSEKECKAIMGFPEDFKVPVSRTQMYRQFGNSVAIPVVEAIAKQMVKVLKNKTKK